MVKIANVIQELKNLFELLIKRNLMSMQNEFSRWKSGERTKFNETGRVNLNWVHKTFKEDQQICGNGQQKKSWKRETKSTIKQYWIKDPQN